MYYSTKKDYGTLGFCYQLGLGVTRDLEQAIRYFKLVIQEEQLCFWDLLLCYKSMPNECKENTLKEFEKELVKTNCSNSYTQCQKLCTLAYLYERGGPDFDQNLYQAVNYYSMDYGVQTREKYLQLNTLTAFNREVQKACAEGVLYNKGIASLIAEYGFEIGGP